MMLCVTMKQDEAILSAACLDERLLGCSHIKSSSLSTIRSLLQQH